MGKFVEIFKGVAEKLSVLQFLFVVVLSPVTFLLLTGFLQARISSFPNVDELFNQNPPSYFQMMVMAVYIAVPMALTGIIVIFSARMLEKLMDLWRDKKNKELELQKAIQAEGRRQEINEIFIKEFISSFFLLSFKQQKIISIFAFTDTCRGDIYSADIRDLESNRVIIRGMKAEGDVYIFRLNEILSDTVKELVFQFHKEKYKEYESSFPNFERYLRMLDESYDVSLIERSEYEADKEALWKVAKTLSYYESGDYLKICFNDRGNHLFGWCSFINNHLGIELCAEERAFKLVD
ncbi:hypothetical protein [Vibrio nigripulchritudo]|uniref:hypothetical protein n=1 Tax=Vibrio nigripulchritudo TaxID=28173 RepID=UPI0024919244|nr:hypothetical protein [Vibrio nigripulchritudo]BDU42902.1 hypothetical protein TUMSATVNIG3_17000 [Vibrio nigripulchritudo]